MASHEQTAISRMGLLRLRPISPTDHCFRLYAIFYLPLPNQVLSIRIIPLFLNTIPLFINFTNTKNSRLISSQLCLCLICIYNFLTVILVPSSCEIVWNGILATSYKMDGICKCVRLPSTGLLARYVFQLPESYSSSRLVYRYMKAGIMEKSTFDIHARVQS